MIALQHQFLNELIAMQNSKLLQTLKLFSREELDVLGDFLRSPYFFADTNHHLYSQLFQYVMSFYDNWEHPDLSKERTFQKLFPGQKFLLSRMDRLMTSLLKNIHHFVYIHFKDIEEASYLEIIALIRFFRDRSEDKLMSHYTEKAKKRLQTLKVEGSQFYYNHFLLDEELLEQYILKYTNKAKIDQRKLFNALDVFYLLKKLEQACFLLSLHRFQNPQEMSGIIPFLDSVRSAYEQLGITNIPLVKVYYGAYDLLRAYKDSETDYWSLKKLIEQHRNEIPTHALKVFYGLLRNFTIIRYNLGAKHLNQEIFDLHRSHLEDGYLYFNNGILPGVYKNIVTLGLRVREYDWIFNFIHEYRYRIEGAKKPEDVYNYNLAVYYFEINEYEKALDLLADQYEDVIYKVAAKRMELKIYYEMQSEIIDSKIDAFKVYVFRLSELKVLKLKQTLNNNFINTLRQLRNPRTIHSEEKLRKLEKKIEKMTLVSEKEWLLSKVRNLLNV